MTDCKAEVAITRKASDLNVTPTDEEDRPVGTLPSLVQASAAPGDAAAPGTTADVAPADAAPAAAAAADPALIAAGEEAFRQCQTCHEVGEGAKNKTGPHLNGVFGRTAGTVEGFRYSKQFVAAGEEGLVWTPETLHDFLMKPRDYIKGTRMSFAGFREEADIAAVTAYLQTYSE
jgi:cytochrome c